MPTFSRPSRPYTTVVIGGISHSTSTALPTLTSTIVMPLLYVIRVALVLPEDDDPAFRDEDSKYISIDMEMIAHASILSDEADTSNKDTSDLEANGPFVPTFPVDSKKV